MVGRAVLDSNARRPDTRTPCAYSRAPPSGPQVCATCENEDEEVVEYLVKDGELVLHEDRICMEEVRAPRRRRG